MFFLQTIELKHCVINEVLNERKIVGIRTNLDGLGFSFEISKHDLWSVCSVPGSPKNVWSVFQTTVSSQLC